MPVTVAAALTFAMEATTSAAPTSSDFAAVLTASTYAEMPAEAADLVAQADAKALKQTTIDVVKAAIGQDPAAAPAIVGAIAHATPAMAGTAAATAALLMPRMKVDIARAAAKSAPAQAGAIVEAICRVSPAAYKMVAEAVAKAVPDSDKAILAAIAAALPELDDSINQTIASYSGAPPTLSMVLSQISSNPSVDSVIASGTLPSPSTVSSAPHAFGGFTAPIIPPPPIPPAPDTVWTPVPPGAPLWIYVDVGVAGDGFDAPMGLGLPGIIRIGQTTYDALSAGSPGL